MYAGERPGLAGALTFPANLRLSQLNKQSNGWGTGDLSRLLPGKFNINCGVVIGVMYLWDDGCGSVGAGAADSGGLKVAVPNLCSATALA